MGFREGMTGYEDIIHLPQQMKYDRINSEKVKNQTGRI